MFQVFSIFSDINISQGTVATSLIYGRYFNVVLEITGKSVSERTLKIGQHLAKL